MKTTISEKGQVTIPKALRLRLGLTPGVVLDFDASEGRLIGRKRVGGDVLTKWRGRGRLPCGLTVDRYLGRCRQ